MSSDLLGNIRREIADRMKDLRPAVEEYEVQETMLAVLTGKAKVVATTKQRRRKSARRRHHNNDQQHVAYLNDEQVGAMKTEAKRKKMGLARYMAKHGYENDGKGWTVQS